MILFVSYVLDGIIDYLIIAHTQLKFRFEDVTVFLFFIKSQKLARVKEGYPRGLYVNPTPRRLGKNLNLLLVF